MDPRVALLLFWSACGPLGARVAGQKNRPMTEGFLLGFLFGPFGVIVEVLLPAGANPTRTKPREKRRWERPLLDEVVESLPVERLPRGFWRAVVQNLFAPPPHRRKR